MEKMMLFSLDEMLSVRTSMQYFNPARTTSCLGTHTLMIDSLPVTLTTMLCVDQSGTSRGVPLPPLAARSSCLPFLPGWTPFAPPVVGVVLCGCCRHRAVKCECSSFSSPLRVLSKVLM
jgi:hypothetical protein